MAIRFQTGIRTRKACDIAGIDSARFNEMVHAGQYKCAPETRPGSARLFNLDYTVALKIFGDLLKMSLAPNQAGRIACSAYRHFLHEPNVERLAFVLNASAEWIIVEESQFTQMANSTAPRIVLPIAELREHVGDRHDWELKFGKGDTDAAS